MEDERYRELLERVTNFNWAVPDRTLTREEFEEQQKRFRKFSRALRLEFPEWHFSDGSRVNQFVGGERSTHGAIQPELRKVWKLASSGENEKAERQLRKLSESYAAKAERAMATTSSWYNLEKHETEVVSRNPRPKEAATLRKLVETLEWLQSRLGRLKVCEYPKCTTGRTYFFRAFSNDRYCCSKCAVRAKALRQAKRDAESPKPPKNYKLPSKTRAAMSIAAILRHANERTEKARKSTRGD